jgi:hypothetical protein
MASLQGFQPVTALMGRIKESGNEFPRVRLAFGDTPLVLTVAGDKSRFPGSVSMTDGGRYPAARFFGRINPQGDFVPSPVARNLPQEDKRALWQVLSRLKGGEAEVVFAEYGKRFGCCAMCGRELTNEESVALGIGPVCREKAFG